MQLCEKAIKWGDDRLAKQNLKGLSSELILDKLYGYRAEKHSAILMQAESTDIRVDQNQAIDHFNPKTGNPIQHQNVRQQWKGLAISHRKMKKLEGRDDVEFDLSKCDIDNEFYYIARGIPITEIRELLKHEKTKHFKTYDVIPQSIIPEKYKVGLNDYKPQSDR